VTKLISEKNIHSYLNKKRIIEQDDNSISIVPHSDLQKYIINYGITFSAYNTDIIPKNFTIMPSGQAVLIFYYNCDTYLSTYLYGASTKPEPAGSPTVEMLITIEFQVGGLYPFINLDQNSLTDKLINFNDINHSLNNLITEAVEKYPDLNELINIFDEIFLANINDVPPAQIYQTIQTIIETSGKTTVKELAESVHYSERQLNRIFNQFVGFSPKILIKLVRVNNALYLMDEPHHSLEFISEQIGYYDSSHFVRDFKSIFGFTLQDYRHNMSDFYIVHY
jgi:AraC-like DNA-binding protein